MEKEISSLLEEKKFIEEYSYISDCQLIDYIKKEIPDYLYFGEMHSLSFLANNENKGLVVGRYAENKKGRLFIGTNTFLEKTLKTGLNLNELNGLANEMSLDLIYRVMKMDFNKNLNILLNDDMEESQEASKERLVIDNHGKIDGVSYLRVVTRD